MVEDIDTPAEPSERCKPWKVTTDPVPAGKCAPRVQRSDFLAEWREEVPIEVVALVLDHESSLVKTKQYDLASRRAVRPVDADPARAVQRAEAVDWNAFIA
jgi:hypothetical protein